MGICCPPDAIDALNTSSEMISLILKTASNIQEDPHGCQLHSIPYHTHTKKQASECLKGQLAILIQYTNLKNSANISSCSAVGSVCGRGKKKPVFPLSKIANCPFDKCITIKVNFNSGSICILRKKKCYLLLTCSWFFPWTCKYKGLCLKESKTERSRPHPLSP